MPAQPEQTLEQMRMRFALEAVKQSKTKLTAKQFKEFTIRCHSLPAQILQNGLNQALAFCLSRPIEKAPPYEALVQYVSDWLTGRGLAAGMNLAHPVAVLPLPAKDSSDTRSIMEVLLANDIDTYMAATQEALALLHHLKRFASAFKVEDPTKAEGATEAKNGS